MICEGSIAFEGNCLGRGLPAGAALGLLHCNSRIGAQLDGIFDVFAVVQHLSETVLQLHSSYDRSMSQAKLVR